MNDDVPELSIETAIELTMAELTVLQEATEEALSRDDDDRVMELAEQSADALKQFALLRKEYRAVSGNES